MLFKQLPNLRPAPVWQEHDLKEGKYFVVILNSPENIDIPESLRAYLRILSKETRGLPVIFPTNPRTANNLSALKNDCRNFRSIEMPGYVELIHLVRSAKGVITDSRKLSEETTMLGIPCLSLREYTEIPETMTVGTNELIGNDPQNLLPALNRLFDGKWKKGGIPDKWDGHTGERIVVELERLMAE